jgi:hypothetical protein
MQPAKTRGRSNDVRMPPPYESGPKRTTFVQA